LSLLSFIEKTELTRQSPAREEGETFLGILLFGLGTGLLTMVLAPSSGGTGFIIAFIAGLLLAGGLDLIIHRTRF
jgi:hypothetical protein